jgi:sulfur-carrier protein
VRVRVQLFALARQVAGCDAVEVELQAGATIASLRKELERQAPQSPGLLRHSMFAVDSRYVPDDFVLSPDADVACIPPVSGG